MVSEEDIKILEEQIKRNNFIIESAGENLQPIDLQLTKVNQAIENLLKEYKELKEENIRERVAKEELEELLENSIPKSLVEENLKGLEKYFNEVVNIPNNRGLIDQLIEYEKTKAKIEAYRELLKGDE